MVMGYFVFEIFLYGLGAALFDIVANSVQGVFGVAVGAVIYSVFHKTDLIKKLFKE